MQKQLCERTNHLYSAPESLDDLQSEIMHLENIRIEGSSNLSIVLYLPPKQK